MAAQRYGSGKGEASLADHMRSLDRAAETLPPVVVAYGPDGFLRLEAALRFREAWLARHPDGEVATLRAAGEAKPLAYADLAAELSGGSLFARDKLVVVRQAERLLFPVGKGEDDDGKPGREKALVQFLENPSPGFWLFMESAQLPKNRIMGKKIAGLCELVPCPALSMGEASRWLRLRAEGLGKRLDQEASELLLLAHGADLGRLASELEKLILFVDEAAEIGSAAVGEFLTGSVEFDIFGLTNAVEERNAAKALSFARKIAVLGTRDQKGKKDDGERAAHRALAMLAGTAQSLLRAGTAKFERRSAADFAAADRISPWRAERLLAAAGRYTMRELRAMAGLAADGIKRSHDTGGDARLMLERLAVALAEGGAGSPA